MKKGHGEHRIFFCKFRFGTMKMHVRTSGDLDLYLVANNKHMKVIDAYYSIRVGHWA